ncbi:hypothetical protein NK718_19365 [Alsobacter sp. SYSU M60028]|uniref:Uncharacterized protein n=1 Tax=Alsobacter ponti TaxID=2962936 RepID=A0ABT1LHW9_9HYPH|nr:hypothetical protein [Alsobacter ponti]MCP8940691.1 hypothetical protein [Alsobacter ponti]
MTAPPLLAAACGLLALALAGPARADGELAADPSQQACPDAGSFAVVDDAATPRARAGEPLVARSWNPCADLPDPRPAPLLDVQIGVFPKPDKDYGPPPKRR